jgi:hypothetical protein
VHDSSITEPTKVDVSALNLSIKLDSVLTEEFQRERGTTSTIPTDRETVGTAPTDRETVGTALTDQQIAEMKVVVELRAEIAKLEDELVRRRTYNESNKRKCFCF